LIRGGTAGALGNDGGERDRRLVAGEMMERQGTVIHTSE
jgi:hypothetical protein